MLRVAEQAQRTDTGRQRNANEDSFYARPPVFAVADGMGGAQAGEVASQIAAESFEPAERGEESAESFLRAIAERANARIHELAQQDSSRSGMGTTLTAAIVEGDEVSFAHVGDSRAYRYRDGDLKLLTSDHSLVEELRRQGRLTSEQAADHPQRSIITRALGPESEVEVDTMTYSARSGDVYLICSDGLTTMVSEARIAAALAEQPELDRAVARLVREANEAGGRDNITAVAFRLEQADQRAAAADGATLIGPTAAEADLSAARVRREAERSAERSRGRRAPAPAAERRGRSRLRTAAKALVAVLVVAARAFGAWYGARQVYFLGADEGGRLALFRGLPYDLPFGIELYSEVYSVGVQVDSLPSERQGVVSDHEMRSRDDALSLLDDLQVAAAPPAPGGGRRQGGAGAQNGDQGQGGGGQGGGGQGGGGGSGPGGGAGRGDGR